MADTTKANTPAPVKDGRGRPSTEESIAMLKKDPKLLNAWWTKAVTSLIEKRSKILGKETEDNLINAFAITIKRERITILKNEMTVLSQQFMEAVMSGNTELQDSIQTKMTEQAAQIKAAHVPVTTQSPVINKASDDDNDEEDEEEFDDDENEEEEFPV